MHLIRLIGLATAIALWCSSASAHERPATAPAARFLQEHIDRALVLARPPVSRKDNDELAILIRDAIDWPTLTRYAIGHYGAKLDAGGLSEVGAQLEQQLGQLARRAGKEMPTLTIALRGLRIDSDGNRHVLSTAGVPRFGAIEVEWTLRPTATGYRVSDISALGLSLRQFLRGWVTSLVAAQGGDPTAVFNGEPSDSDAGASPQ
jgi:hypothetical protein